MDGNRMYSKSGVGNRIGVEMPLHTVPQQPQPQPQNSQLHFQNHNNHHNIMAFTHQNQQHHEQHQTNLSMKQPSSYLPYTNPSPNQNPNPYPSPNANPNPCLKSKTQMTNSEDDEPNSANDQENSSLDGKRKGSGSSNMVTSPWQRMKWTDNMVRLLIMAVYYIGDEAGNEVTSDKKKSGGGGGVGGGLQQKKGKWKSVSRAMMEKGFYVSPQQCEDKFNDLNKRYKRVNDILGRGTACRVVENQSLLETMDITPKMKEEVRKLLNSKHLFFKEMCAYHNSCGHGGGTGAHPSEAAAAAGSTLSGSDGQQQQTQQQNSCLQHSSSIPPSSAEMIKARASRLGSDGDDDDADDEDDDEDDDDYDDDDEDVDDDGGARKRAKIHGGISSNTSHALQKFSGELMGVLQNGSKNSWEKKQWMTTQLVLLEEEGLKFKSRALELEKQRLKWLKFSSKKEREMEQMKLDNERQRLENERMMLLLKQNEIELLVVDPQQQQQPSCVSV